MTVPVDRRFLVGVVLSAGAHAAVAIALRGPPIRAVAPEPPAVEMLLVEPSPEPPVAPAPPPEPTRLKRSPVEHAQLHHVTEVATAQPREVPPPERPSAPAEAPGLPLFGVSMESTSTAGGGPTMPVGSPGAPHEGRGGGDREVKNKDDGAVPVPAYEVTAMPLPQGRCSGKYTDQAKQAAIEGTVVVDLVVGADGRVRDARVVRGLGYGLDEAALAAARTCRFSPGQRGETPVAVRVREFKIRFLLSSDD